MVPLTWTPYDLENDVVIENASALSESEKALYVVCSDGRRGWVPKSQLRRYSDCYYPGDCNVTLVVSRWWARKAKWIT